MAVYFLREMPDGAIKIGYTASDPRGRAATLQTGNPRPLEILAVIPDGTPAQERELHARFASLRISGEWFRAEPALLGFIDGIRYAMPLVDARAWHQPGVEGLTEDQLLAIAGFIRARDVTATLWNFVIDVGDDLSCVIDDMHIGEAERLVEALSQMMDDGTTPEQMGAHLCVERWSPEDRAAYQELARAVADYRMDCAEAALAGTAAEGVSPHPRWEAAPDDLLPHEVH